MQEFLSVKSTPVFGNVVVRIKSLCGIRDDTVVADSENFILIVI